jgi:hypothetical protein
MTGRWWQDYLTLSIIHVFSFSCGNLNLPPYDHPSLTFIFNLDGALFVKLPWSSKV